MIKILVAPNSFKGCASSVDVAELISRKIFNYAPDPAYQVDQMPVSDGGDGFMDVIYRLYPKSVLKEVEIPSYFNNSRTSQVNYLFDPLKSRVIIESARVIGLALNQSTRGNPLIYNTLSYGTLIKYLLNCRKEGLTDFNSILSGFGGSGTNDLGMGAASAFGLKMYDEKSSELEPVPVNFHKAKRIHLPERNTEIKFKVIHDVDIPLVGETGPSLAFSHQKGASREQALLMEHGNKRIIEIIAKMTNKSNLETLNGAAGGLSLGLSLIFDLEFQSSRDFLKTEMRLEERIASSEIVITGEGRFDEQSLMEKASGIIMDICRNQGKKLFILCGENTLEGKADLYGEFILLKEKEESVESAMRNFDKKVDLAVKEIISKLKF